MLVAFHALVPSSSWRQRGYDEIGLLDGKQTGEVSGKAISDHGKNTNERSHCSDAEQQFERIIQQNRVHIIGYLKHIKSSQDLFELNSLG